MKACCWRKKWDCLCRCLPALPRRAARKLGAWMNSSITFSTTAKKNTASDCAPDARGTPSKWLKNLGSSWSEPKRRIEYFPATIGRSSSILKRKRCRKLSEQAQQLLTESCFPLELHVSKR